MPEEHIPGTIIKPSSEILEQESDSKARVLVVDDDSRIMTFLRVSLKLAGFNVITTTDGGEALRMVGSENPEIMLLDILMSPMDGFEVLKRLRPVSGLPVIAISAHDSVANEALSLGANDFLSKPFRPEELIQRIRKILNRGK